MFGSPGTLYTLRYMTSPWLRCDSSFAANAPCFFFFAFRLALPLVGSARLCGALNLIDFESFLLISGARSMILQVSSVELV